MNDKLRAKISQHFSGYRRASYSKGEILLRASERPKFIFYIETGKVRQYDISSRGDIVVVNVYGPGAFFPMTSTLGKTVNGYFFEAETELTVRMADPDDTISWLKSEPDVTFDLLSRISSGLDGVLSRIVRLMSASAASRLIHELVVECRRFGESRPEGCFLNLSQNDLASRTGLTRETVSRELHKLSPNGELEIRRGGLLVRDPDWLQDKLRQIDQL